MRTNRLAAWTVGLLVLAVSGCATSPAEIEARRAEALRQSNPALYEVERSQQKHYQIQEEALSGSSRRR